MLSAMPTEHSFRLNIFVDGVRTEIPAEVGVHANDSTESLFTVDDDGVIYLDQPRYQSVGDFFDIWRDHAGLAGDNPSAFLGASQLMGNSASGEHTIQMFVNGQVASDFEKHVVQDGDEVVLVYGVNPVLSLNTNQGPVVLELFASQTPITVENFLNYVNDGDYNGSFFHRSVTEFVIQGGGFRTTSTVFSDTDQFSSVPADAAIQNEPGISNLRGTIAMAKRSGDPDSATSQFFVNLSDANVAPFPGPDLNNQNEGFTVFGHVLDMTTVDDIAALSIVPANTLDSTITYEDSQLYSSLPLGPGNELVVVQSVAGQGDLSGRRYLDGNLNGRYDPGEAPLPGTLVYLDANDNGVLDSGEEWVETHEDGSYRFQLEAGMYAVRTASIAGTVRTEPWDSGSHVVSVEIGRETQDVNFGEVELDPPSSIELSATSDTGKSNHDNLTRANNVDQAARLQFLVSGVTPGVNVLVFVDGQAIGSAIAIQETVTVTTDGLHRLSDGIQSVTAVQALGGMTGHCDPLEIVVDTTAPLGLAFPPRKTARSMEPYLFDLDSPEEGDISYSLEYAPEGMGIVSLTGKIVWTPAENQAGQHSFNVVVSDGAGNVTSQAVTIDVLEAISPTDLGKVDFQRLDSLLLTNLGDWWRLETVREGWLTVLSPVPFAADEMSFELYDPADSTTPLVHSDPAEGAPRIDREVRAEEVYLLRVVGSASDARLLLANLVHASGNGVTVQGTASDDEFVFDASSARKVTINGIPYDYAQEEALSVEFNGGEGEDVAWLFDSTDDENLEAWPDHAVLTNSATDVPAVYVVQVDGVEELLSYATAGGHDIATLHGSEADDKLKSYEQSVRLRAKNSSYSLRAKSFDKVVGDSGTDGDDIAIFGGSRGTETFTFGGDDMTAHMAGDARDHTARDFKRVIARAGGGEGDAAHFTGIPDTKDVVYFKSHKTQLVNDYVEVTARGFDEVHASALGERVDVARMYDSDSDEHLEIAGDIARFYRHDSSELQLLYEATAFYALKAYSTEGGDTIDIGDTDILLLLSGWNE